MTGQQKLEALARRKHLIRARDLESAGIARSELRRAVDRNILTYVSRGVYRFASAEPTAHDVMIEACLRVPQGVVCLLSALNFHQLGTQAPHLVWMAIDVKARKPQSSDLPLKIVRFSGIALTDGIETHQTAAGDIRVYCAAKTVADCFKYRNKTGLDVALEALRDYIQNRTGTIDEIWKYAKVCRVSKVMRPYLEAMI
ncbi:MAG: transcriptional regulator [Verrucomicrobia bacterium]|jgi:predicted transcriptional regulator of viral defense system|nr:transcriptional regulator [Verrucomicrobiota bacterium]